MQVQSILKINEVFYSIQGEGFLTGMPVVFVRFAGCNLACSWCDTEHKEHFLMSVDDVIKRVIQYPTRYVVITGGEPTLQGSTLQSPLYTLTKELRDIGYFVAIETNGTRVVDREKFDWVTVSPKVPPRKVRQARGNELKVIYMGQDVEAYFNHFVYQGKPMFDHHYLQPLSGKNVEETVAYVKQHPHWRLSLQCQKLICIR